MPDRKLKRVPRVRDEEVEVPQRAMENLEGKGVLSPYPHDK